MRPVSVFSGLVGVVLVGLGIVYLAVACQSLPGILGPTRGDASPRTPLGIGILVLGLLVLGGAGVMARRGRAG